MNRLVLSAFARQRVCSLMSKNARFYSSASDKMIVDIDSKTGIATMYMNSPPVNGLDSGMLMAATKAVKEAEENKDVRGIIVTSKFDGQVFCAGLNIMDMYQKSHDHLIQFWSNVQNWYMSWYGCKKPTVAAINGHAPAGGCAWALTCDYRIMQSGAGKTIGLNETKLGIVAPFFFIGLIKAAIGHRTSEAALLKGTMFQAEEALKCGLVDDIAPLEDLIPKATTELKSLMAVPLEAYGLTKMLMRQESLRKLAEVKKQDCEMFAGLVSQPKVQEALGMYVAALKARKKN